MNFFGADTSASPTRSSLDRRASDRFPIEREVRFKMLSKRHGSDVGLGTTLNMSSSGVLFTTDRALLPGKRLEMAISWPAQLENRMALKLVAKGRIVRCESGTAAVEIQQYEFRTIGTQGMTL